MTVFRKSVSWSKFLHALECPRRLQNILDKVYTHRTGGSRAGALGKLVQKVFELYFNNDFNLQDKGRRPEVLLKMLDKVLQSKWALDEEIDASFKEDAVPQILQGYETFAAQKLLGFRIRSEVKTMAVYDGFRMF